jgi:hypothetical protein
MFQHAPGGGSRLGRRTLATVAVCAAVGSGAYISTIFGQDLPQAQSSADSFQQTVVPVLSKNCFSCHSDRLHTANLSLESFRDQALALQHPEVWVKVLDKLKAGTMPPRTMPPLSPSDLTAVTGWIEKTQGVAAAPSDASSADPGRVTARRLNRTEYNNTIRDLLGVSIHPADEFPVDDAGYGFDNIGDVLSMSPMLMEKYMSAAQTVSKVAVYGETYPAEPTQIVKLLPKKFQDDTPAAGNVLPYSFRGAAYGTLHVPVDGEYEFRFRYANYRGANADLVDQPADAARGGRGRAAAAGSAGPPGAPGDAGTPAGRGRGAGRGGRGFALRPPPTPEELKAREEKARAEAPPEPLNFTIDGATVYSYTVEGSGAFDYSHGENIFRTRLSAGDHAMRASFPGLANIANPRNNVNPDLRRKLYIDYVIVLGPFSPSTAPPASFKNIFICGEPGHYTQACARHIIENLATRAYRRPATPQEVQKLASLAALVQKKDSFEESIRVVLEAVLMSPNFLFRIEQDQPAALPAGAGAYPVSDYELASRLSYFLWSSMPDDELMQAAAKRLLRQPSVLNAELQRMLGDPKSAALVENFGGQWLNLRLMDRKKPDAQKFNVVDDELLDAMRQETIRFVDAVIHEDRSILDFIDGRFTFVNGPLARYYGIKGVDGEPLQRVDLDGDERSGIVTQGSVLTISSYATRTSPVLRGKWVLDNLLGAAPPPPPPGVPALLEADLGTAASMRQRLEQHRANPSCSVCHNQMDPMGFGLENYDAAGAWRTREGNFEIDSSGTLPDGRSFTGATGLKQILRAQSDAFARNFVEKLLTYALGRGLESTDRPVVDQIRGELARNGYRFSTLVTAIAGSRPFQMRTRISGDGGTE